MLLSNLSASLDSKKQGRLPRLLRGRRATTGFSLVEIALALGIMSFALVALIGMIPVGIQTASSARDATNEALIAQTLFAEAQLCSYTDLPSLETGSSKRYFTNEALGAKASDPLVAYTAEVTMNPDWTPEGMAPVPGSAAASAELTLMHVNITKISAPKERGIFTSIIANRGF